jgi:prepilin-type N-terminal cleavage/methylation domain-containing protein
MNSRAGFTIVELLVVIVVIGILASITIVSYSGIANQATVASIKTNLENNAKKMKMYYTIHGQYPISFDVNNCPDSPVIDNNYCLSMANGSSYKYSSPSTETFSIIETNGINSFYVTENSSPDDINTLSTGLAGQWNFEEGVGNIISDDIGNNDGTWNGTLGSQWVTGKVGNYSGRFNGSDSFVSTGYTQTAVTEYSITAWIKTLDGAVRKTIVNNRGDAGTGKSLTLGIGASGGGHGSAGCVSFEVDSNATDIGISSIETVNDDTWHHVAGVWSAPSGTAVNVSQFSIYIDGAKASTVSGSTGSATSPLTGLDGTIFGRHVAWNTYLNASVDDIRIYTKALSSHEIATIYNSTK